MSCIRYADQPSHATAALTLVTPRYFSLTIEVMYILTQRSFPKLSMIFDPSCMARSRPTLSKPIDGERLSFHQASRPLAKRLSPYLHLPPVRYSHPSSQPPDQYACSVARCRLQPIMTLSPFSTRHKFFAVPGMEAGVAVCSILRSFAGGCVSFSWIHAVPIVFLPVILTSGAPILT